MFIWSKLHRAHEQWFDSSNIWKVTSPERVTVSVFDLCTTLWWILCTLLWSSTMYIRHLKKKTMLFFVKHWFQHLVLHLINYHLVSTISALPCQFYANLSLQCLYCRRHFSLLLFTAVCFSHSEWLSLPVQCLALYLLQIQWRAMQFIYHGAVTEYGWLCHWMKVLFHLVKYNVFFILVVILFQVCLQLELRK